VNLTDERYLLADPFVCLICGRPSEYGIHYCGDASCRADDGRFVHIATDQEIAEQTAGIASSLGITYAAAQQEVSLLGHKWGDYSEHAKTFFRALHDYRNSQCDCRGDCPDCVGNPPPSDYHPISMMMWQVSIECPFYKLHTSLFMLTHYEDRRHGLSPGSTWAEMERRDRNKRIASRLENIQGKSVMDIIDNALGVAD